MKKILFTFIVTLFLPVAVSAHPGIQDKEGCHVCTKNCDAWSVKWNVKHCHGGRKNAPRPFQTIESGHSVKQSQTNSKLPGWEYGIEIKNIGFDRPVSSKPGY